ncbi:SDR family oxidoreductase [Rhodococcus erythropolis]|uniref:SDR family oxidoreductase n=1 Tax=Rhodococcus erythropolis TaxID=1833 RepID=UPI002226B30A|nr:SDR family oxidoreductase [Rhodococcus erythropolis]MCW2295450.1 NAD(P)H dehydrogenase (quinone) [Rhodococcus erythropolis]
MTIVVTAATGQLGRLVIDELLERVPATEIAAVVRDPVKAAGLADKNVELRIADYDDVEALENAFHVGDVVLLISGTEPGRRTAQHKNVLTAAIAAGASRIAYTSVIGGLGATFALASEQHKPTELALLQSGLPYTILRNGWYTENYTDQIATQLEHGLTGAAGAGQVGSATRRDFAAAAAVVLSTEGHENAIYELSGDSAWTFTEYAAELSRQSGTAVSYRNVSVNDLADILAQAGLPREQAEVFADIDAAIERGEFRGGSGDLSRLIGRATTPLSATLADALASLKVNQY